MTLIDTGRKAYVCCTCTHTHTHRGRITQAGAGGTAQGWSLQAERCGGAGEAPRPVALPSCFLKQVLACTGILDLQPRPSLGPTQKIPTEVETGDLQDLYGHFYVCLHSLFFIILQSFKPGKYYLHHWEMASTNCSRQIIFGRTFFTKRASTTFCIRWKNLPPSTSQAWGVYGPSLLYMAARAVKLKALISQKQLREVKGNMNFTPFQCVPKHEDVGLGQHLS